MHMVWHDAPRKEPIAFLIEVAQGVGHFFCDGGVLQVTSARATVEEAFNHWGRETRDSRAFIGAEVAPKTDSSLDDGLALGFDAIKNGLGKRIGQAKGEEVGGAVFFPVGEPAAIVNFDLAKAGAGCWAEALWMSAPNTAASAYLGRAIISESQESTTGRSIRRILSSRSKDHEIFHCHARVRVWGWRCPSPNQLFHLFS